MRKEESETYEPGIDLRDNRNLEKAKKFLTNEKDPFEGIPKNWSKLSAKEKNQALGEKFFDEEEEARRIKAKNIAIAKSKKYLVIGGDEDE